MVFFSDFSSLFYIVFKYFFFCEVLFIQLILLYIVVLYLYQNNIYYNLLYFFYIIILYGLFLCIIQCEFFTGFLWVTEFTVIFIALILLFYLNIDGLKYKFFNKISNVNNIIIAILLILIFLYYSLFFFNELARLELFNFYILYEDYYEALNNNYSNDFSPLFISYYLINSFLFILITLILFITSLICVKLYKNNKKLSSLKVYYFLDNFKINNIFYNHNFIKKQNLLYQSNLKPNLIIFNSKL